MNLTYESIAQKIDHALLSPTMTELEMIAGCDLAKLYEVATVCVKPAAIRSAVERLAGSQVGIGTVVGFPHGGQTTAIKVAETIDAISAGASEIDMVVNIGAVLGSQWDLIEKEVEEIARITQDRQALIKVIFETCYLQDDQKIRLCEICNAIQVGYIKTSTGFGTNGATSHDLKLMMMHKSSNIKLKASGGIKDLETAIQYVDIGSERLGTSRTVDILEELLGRLGLPPRDVSRGTKRASIENY